MYNEYIIIAYVMEAHHEALWQWFPLLHSKLFQLVCLSKRVEHSFCLCPRLKLHFFYRKASLVALKVFNSSQIFSAS